MSMSITIEQENKLVGIIDRIKYDDHRDTDVYLMEIVNALDLTFSEGPEDHRYNSAPFCAKCGDHCQMKKGL